MTTVRVFEIAGEFAENKDAAKRMRETELAPTLSQGGAVTLDFRGVNLATQSFVHALISEVIRREGSGVLDRLTFKGCNENIKGLISIVVEYSQDKTE